MYGLSLLFAIFLVRLPDWLIIWINNESARLNSSLFWFPTCQQIWYKLWWGCFSGVLWLKLAVIQNWAWLQNRRMKLSASSSPLRLHILFFLLSLHCTIAQSNTTFFSSRQRGLGFVCFVWIRFIGIVCTNPTRGSVLLFSLSATSRPVSSSAQCERFAEWQIKMC